MNGKEQVISMVLDMPRHLSASAVVARLQVLDEIRRGEQDISAGRVLSQEQVARKLRKWLAR